MAVNAIKRVRYCINPLCKREIRACNGFVVARDVLLAYENKLRWDQVRELCGVCVFKFEGNKIKPLLVQVGYRP